MQSPSTRTSRINCSSNTRRKSQRSAGSSSRVQDREVGYYNENPYLGHRINTGHQKSPSALYLSQSCWVVLHSISLAALHLRCLVHGGTDTKWVGIGGYCSSYSTVWTSVSHSKHLHRERGDIMVTPTCNVINVTVTTGEWTKQQKVHVFTDFSGKSSTLL